MRNAARAGRHAVTAIRMDGRGPPSRPQNSYGPASVSEIAEPVIYTISEDFLASIREDFGAVGKAADAYLTEGDISVVYPFGRNAPVLLYSNGGVHGRLDTSSDDIEAGKIRLKESVDRGIKHV